MKTVEELRGIIGSYPWARVDAHVHTHLCDGRPEMTVCNIASRARQTGMGLIILTPHLIANENTAGSGCRSGI